MIVDLLKRNRGAMIFLIINVFLAFIGMGLVIPVMPTYMDVLGISGTIIGFIVAAYALSEFIISPYAGRWSDLYGRKSMIVIGMFLFALAELIFGLANGTVMLFVGRILGGVGAGFIMPAVLAYTADITTDRDRALGMGWINVALSLGFIVGPALGGYLIQFGPRVPFIAAAIMALIAAILTWLVLPESLTKEKQVNNQDTKQESQIRGLIQAYKTPYFIGLLILLIASLGLSQYETVIGLFLDAKFSYNPQQIASLIMIGAIVAAIVQVLFYSPLITYFGEKIVVKYSLLVSAIFMVMTILANSYWVLAVTVSTIFITIDFIRPSISTYFSRIAGNEQGYVAGLNASYTSIGYILGPLFAGMLFDLNLSAAFIMGAVAMGSGALLSLYWRK